jgi:hypothetical protein
LKQDVENYEFDVNKKELIICGKVGVKKNKSVELCSILMMEKLEK